MSEHTPKEKAKELVDNMWIYSLPNANGSWNNAKQCALIAVDENINFFRQIILDFHLDENEKALEIYRSLKKVKTEIEKL